MKKNILFIISFLTLNMNQVQITEKLDEYTASDAGVIVTLKKI